MFETDADESIKIIWLAGGSCEGCSMAVMGAAEPSIENLLLNQIAGLPSVTLIHPFLAFEAGMAFLAQLKEATEGAYSSLVLVVEGTIFDDSIAGDGFFSNLGGHEDKPQTVTNWLDYLVPQATAVIAIGTCATWGGIPAAQGNPTGSMSLTDYLGTDFRSTAGLPIINIPGCAPPGENFIDTLIYLMLHLNEQVPLELDEAHRPAWLYQQETHPQSASPSIPIYQTETAVTCRVPEQGWMNHVGGCATVGGSCNGCTMPGFPDRYLRARG